MWIICKKPFAVPGKFMMQPGEKRQVATELAEDLIRAGYVEPTKGSGKRTAIDPAVAKREKEIKE